MEAPMTGGTPVPARDWSELPLDALSSVFVKLGAVEILMGAGLVCRSWLHAAAKLPELWRSVDMARHGAVVAEMVGDDVLRVMARVAVDRSGGQLEASIGRRFVTDEFLQYIGDRSPDLKAVRLFSCAGVSNQEFTQLISKCPLLEEEDLLLAFCNGVGGRDVCEAIGRACPRLKRFRLGKRMIESLLASYTNWPREALGVAAMHELRTLALVGSAVTNGELAAVLDGCPRLESLDLRYCFSIVADYALRARCAGIKSLVLPRRLKCDDEEDEYYQTLCSRDFDFGSDSD